MSRSVGIVMVLLVAGTLAGFADRETNGLLALYVFEEGEAGAMVPDRSGQDLLGPMQIRPPAVFSPQGIGLVLDGNSAVAGPPAESARDISALMERITGDLTVEMWVKLHPARKGAPIAISAASSRGPEPRNQCVLQQEPFFLMQMGEGAVMGYLNTSLADRCVNPSLTTSNVAHVVFTRRGDRVVLFAGRKERVPASPSLRFGGYGEWPRNATLQLGYLFGSAWAGEIYLVAIYNRSIALSETDPAGVVINFNAFLPNSPPVPTLSSFSLDEDALTEIRLSAYDFDVETAAAYGSARPAALEGLPPLTYTVTSLPARGTLYSAAGDPITPPMLPFRADAQGQQARVLYLPPQDQYGQAFASLRYKVHDGSAESREQSVTLHVLPVNDPPVPTNDVQLADAGAHSVITFKGRDVDEPDGKFVGSAFLIAQPSRGRLFQAEHVQGRLRVAAEIKGASRLNPVKVNNTLQSVFYLPNLPALEEGSGRDIVFTEVLHFLLRDLEGAASVPGNVTVRVRNDLRVLAARPQCVEDVPCRIALNLTDARARAGVAAHSYRFEISSLPSKGVLSVEAEGASSVLSSAPFLLDAGVASVSFQSGPHRSGQAYDAFRFRVWRDFGAQSAYASPEATVTIDVAPVNHPPVIHAPNLVELPFLQNVAVNFSLDDPDATASSKYRIRLLSGAIRAATVSLKPSSLARLVFTVGDGTADSDMDFEAFFPDAVDALNQVELRGVSESYGSTASLTIIAIDQDPLGVQEARRTISLSIVASAQSGGRAAAGESLIPESIKWSIYVGVPALALGCAACCCFYFCRGCFGRTKDKTSKRKRKEQEEEKEEEEEEEAEEAEVGGSGSARDLEAGFSDEVNSGLSGGVVSVTVADVEVAIHPDEESLPPSVPVTPRFHQMTPPRSQPATPPRTGSRSNSNSATPKFHSTPPGRILSATAPRPRTAAYVSPPSPSARRALSERTQTRHVEMYATVRAPASATALTPRRLFQDDADPSPSSSLAYTTPPSVTRTIRSIPPSPSPRSTPRKVPSGQGQEGASAQRRAQGLLSSTSPPRTATLMQQQQQQRGISLAATTASPLRAPASHSTGIGIGIGSGSSPSPLASTVRATGSASSQHARNDTPTSSSARASQQPHRNRASPSFLSSSLPPHLRAHANANANPTGSPHPQPGLGVGQKDGQDACRTPPRSTPRVYTLGLSPSSSPRPASVSKQPSSLSATTPPQLQRIGKGKGTPLSSAKRRLDFSSSSDTSMELPLPLPLPLGGSQEGPAQSLAGSRSLNETATAPAPAYSIFSSSSGTLPAGTSGKDADMVHNTVGGSSGAAIATGAVSSVSASTGGNLPTGPPMLLLSLPLPDPAEAEEVEPVTPTEMTILRQQRACAPSAAHFTLSSTTPTARRQLGRENGPPLCATLPPQSASLDVAESLV